MDPKPDTVLAGRYRIIKPIGQGGAGVVYEARHEEIGKKVALKLLRSDHAQDETAAQRFRREARAVATVGHRAIVDVYDIGRTDDGAMFLVMELLEGQTLRETISREGVLDPAFAAYVTSQVLSALVAAHSAGVVHRDIKPENVFLVRSGQARPAVKLLDFGISMMSDPALNETRLTQSNTVMGTPLYMSPEQAAGVKHVDHSTDIYAAAVVLYECLTGRPPFVADNLLALAAKIQTEEPHKPSDLRGNLPPGLEDVVLCGMARDAEDRHPTAGHFLEDLLPYVEEVDRARLSLPDAVSGVEILATPSGTDSPKAPAVDAETLSPTVHPTDGRKSRVLLWIATLCVVAGLGVGGFVLVAMDTDETPGALTPVVPATESGHRRAPERPTPEADAGAHQVGAAKAPEFVKIELKGLPGGATIQIDGQPCEGPFCEVTKAEGLAEARVSAPGYRPWKSRISRTQDVSLTVELSKIKQLRPRPKKQDEGSSATLPDFGDGP